MNCRELMALIQQYPADYPTNVVGGQVEQDQLILLTLDPEPQPEAKIVTVKPAKTTRKK